MMEYVVGIIVVVIAGIAVYLYFESKKPDYEKNWMSKKLKKIKDFCCG